VFNIENSRIFIMLKNTNSDTDDCVLGFVFNANRTKVLLQKKHRPEWQKGRYNGIGGHIKVGEEPSPSTAMERECKEETGMFIPYSDWRLFATMQMPDTSKVYVFKVFTDMIFNAKDITDERGTICDLDWFRTLPIIDNLEWLIPLALDTKDCKIVTVDYKQYNFETPATKDVGS
jgi:8-oxo-dGTP diphosphatase